MLIKSAIVVTLKWRNVEKAYVSGGKMPSLVSFEQALRETQNGKRHLLLGNGFSIALFPDRFTYGSLLDNADFTNLSEARRAFEELETTDFELVIHGLSQAARLIPLYSMDVAAQSHMQQHVEALKGLLVQAIAGRHPERPSDITEAQYQNCRKFLAHFVGEGRDLSDDGGKDCRAQIYSLNYDLLLYWSLLHEDPLAFDDEIEKLKHDDGFRAPDDDPDAAYVTWEAEGAANSQNIHYLHGALHLFDRGAELEKCCWERSGGNPLVEQIHEALDDNKFPLYVAEGNSESKLTRIRHSGYLQRSLKSFASICNSRDASLFIFGHSLADNDGHVTQFIAKGKVPRVYVGLHGDLNSENTRALVAKAETFAAIRNERFPLEVKFFQSEEARVWG